MVVGQNDSFAIPLYITAQRTSRDIYMTKANTTRRRAKLVFRINGECIDFTGFDNVCGDAVYSLWYHVSWSKFSTAFLGNDRANDTELVCGLPVGYFVSDSCCDHVRVCHQFVAAPLEHRAAFFEILTHVVGTLIGLCGQICWLYGTETAYVRRLRIWQIDNVVYETCCCFDGLI